MSFADPSHWAIITSSFILEGCPTVAEGVVRIHTEFDSALHQLEARS
jgi:hypothetical protein